MKKVTFLVILAGLLLASSQAQAGPRIQVIQLFGENFMESAGPVFPDDPVIRKSTTAQLVLGARDIAILSSTPDGTGTPNVDDFITINGQFVQSGTWIPLAVFLATGSEPLNPVCILDTSVSVNRCTFPDPHKHPVDVSDVIPVGRSTITVDIWDFGGAFGHTELYLIIVPQAFQ